MQKSERAIIFLASVITISGVVLMAGCTEAKLVSEIPKPEPAAIPSGSPSSTTITGTVRYVALGDSTGAGVGAREGGYVARLFKQIVAQRPGSKLTNFCVSGATTSDVLQGQLDRGIAADPNLVTLGIGINDIGHGYELEQFAENYDAILTKLKTTRATIVVANLPDISSAPRIPQQLRGEYQQRIVAFNSKLHEVANRHGVTVFDIFGITHEQLPAHPEYFSADGFHPSDAGYQLWADQMWPAIARTIGADSTQK